MRTVSEELYVVLSPLLAEVGLDLFDVEVTRAEIRVYVDRPGGVDLEHLAEANRIVSAELDERDPFPGRYTLQVSSPGLERRLRTPAHYGKAVGETISVRTLPETTSVRRIQGELTSSDDKGFVLTGPDVPDGSIRLSLRPGRAGQNSF